VSDNEAAETEAGGGVLAAAGWHAGKLLHPPQVGRRGRVLLLLFVLLAWVGSGLFMVGPDESGIVLRFGRWVDTETPGLHYHLPYPIGGVLLPKVTAVNELRSSLTAGHGATAQRMLTGDENLVEADYTVTWKIRSAGDYLFHVQNPEALVGMSAETALREVIGRNPIQAAMSDQRQQIAAAAQDKLQSLLDAYGAGIAVLQVQLQRVDPPAAVIDAFNDVQRARADQVRSRNEADAYRNDILPRARGQAQHITQDAEAYRIQAIDQAQGDAAAYQAAYDAWKAAPDVFARRLYLDAMDDLLRKANRVVVDASGKAAAAVLPYMPLTELPRPAPTPGAKP
jgi:membrane protease subunit HflK